MEKERIKILTILVIILLNSCSPEIFLLNRSEEFPISGLIMKNIDGVEVYADNAVILSGESIVALRSISLTQLQADFTVNLEYGRGLRFAIRSASNNYYNHPSLVFDFTSDGWAVEENGRRIKEGSDIKALKGVPSRLTFENDGDVIKIKVDCEIVYHSKTKIPASEYIIIETLPETIAGLYGIQFNYILQNDPFTRTIEEIIPEPVYLKKSNKD